MSWEYTGDVNPKYGGTWIQVNSQWNYADVVQVTDLDSSCGAQGLIAVERGSVMLPSKHDSRKRDIESAMSCCSLDYADLRGKGKQIVLEMITETLVSYSGADWDGTVILVTSDYYGDKKSWDGWQVDKDESVKLHKKYHGDVAVYVSGEYLQGE